MKKTLCLLLTCLLLGALLCACGKKTISEADLSLTVDGTAVRPDTSASALLDAFGADYTYSEAVSCVYTGMDKTYAYNDLILYTYPDGDTDRLKNPKLLPPEYRSRERRDNHAVEHEQRRQ